jgi:hypothetical protein
MSRLMKIDVVVGTILGVVLFIGGLLATGWYALFHGYFDHGLFEIKQVEWSPSRPQWVAVVAERSDHEALSSNVYFVLIGKHVFSPAELRRAYHSDDVVFAAAGDCLNVTWKDERHLIVSCRDRIIDQQHIDVRKPRAAGVEITYVNIANSTAKDFDPLAAH